MPPARYLAILFRLPLRQTGLARFPRIRLSRACLPLRTAAGLGAVLALCLTHTSPHGGRTPRPCRLLVDGSRRSPACAGCRFALREAVPRSVGGGHSPPAPPAPVRAGAAPLPPARAAASPCARLSLAPWGGGTPPPTTGAP